MESFAKLVQKHHSRGIKTWYIRDRVNGKTTFVSTRTDKRAEANIVFAEYLARPENKHARTASEINIDDAIKGWLSSIVTAHGEGRTFLAYKSRVDRIKSFCSDRKIITLAQVTPIVAQSFAESLSEKLAPKTTNEIVKIFRTIFKWASDQNDIIIRDPFTKTSLPKIKQNRAEFFTMDQVDKIMQYAPNNAFRALWGLMAYAGLRFEEAREIRSEHIHADYLTVFEGKMGKTADVPISSKLRAILDNYTTDGAGPLFGAEIPKRSDKCLIHLREAVFAARIENPGQITHHKLRHSFASELLRRGANAETVKELGRWSSVETLFRHYAHVLRDDLKKAVETL